MPPHLLAALDRFIAEQRPGVSRPEALRIAFRDWAIGHGYLSDSGGTDEAAPGAPSPKAEAAVRKQAAEHIDAILSKKPIDPSEKAARKSRLTDLPASVRAKRKKRGLE